MAGNTVKTLSYWNGASADRIIADINTWFDTGEVKKASRGVRDFLGEGNGPRYQVREIIDKDGNSYGLGVYLDATALDGLSENEQITIVKQYLKSLGGQKFTASNLKRTAIDVVIADSKEKYVNTKGHKSPFTRICLTF